MSYRQRKAYWDNQLRQSRRKLDQQTCIAYWCGKFLDTPGVGKNRCYRCGIGNYCDHCFRMHQCPNWDVLKLNSRTAAYHVCRAFGWKWFKDGPTIYPRGDRCRICHVVHNGGVQCDGNP